MARIVTKEAEEILDVRIKVLDKGFVRLVDYMGGDERVVAAARVSYDKSLTNPERDKQLIFYLMENRHTSPFEQVVITFDIRLPIYCFRQIVRHRTARLNEVSGRYTVLPTDFHSPDSWRTQDNINRQGSLEDFDNKIDQESVDSVYESVCKRAFSGYREMLDAGVAKEQARQVLPVSTFTQVMWQMDLHNLFHFFSLRMDSHAQLETRRYAEAMFEIAKTVAPISCEAFEKFVLNTVTISKDEYEKLKSK